MEFMLLPGIFTNFYSCLFIASRSTHFIDPQTNFRSNVFRSFIC